MTNTVGAREKAAPAAVSSSSKKTTAAKKAVGDKKAPVAKASHHPPVAQMVNEALATLKDRKGSSLQAIKKYIAATYILDAEKQAPYIRKYLKNAVINETIVQTRGTGASGSFKLAGKPAGAKTAKKSAPEKAAAKKSTVKKTAKTKEEVKSLSDKSPLKAKSGKALAAKTKSPKPKKVMAKPTKPAK